MLYFARLFLLFLALSLKVHADDMSFLLSDPSRVSETIPFSSSKIQHFSPLLAQIIYLKKPKTGPWIVDLQVSNIKAFIAILKNFESGFFYIDSYQILPDFLRDIE